MTYDEAIAEAYLGMRIRHDGLPPGVYIEHVFSRGLLKCWPVASPDLEPTRSQCDFITKPEDEAATWFEVPALPSPAPAGVSVALASIAARAKDGWGRGPAPVPVPPAPVGWGKPLPPIAPKPTPAPVAFCAECDYETAACVCSKPEPKKEPNKWGLAI